jgi:UDP-N-acetylmuramate-alanine ligase
MGEVAKQLTTVLKPGDALFTLGAGDIFKLSTVVVEALK